jgi:hypothetical protein
MTTGRLRLKVCLKQVFSASYVNQLVLLYVLPMPNNWFIAYFIMFWNNPFWSLYLHLEGPCLFMLFVLFIVYSDAQRGVLSILVTVRVSYKRKELYFFREHLGSPQFLVESVLPIILVFSGFVFCLFLVLCLVFQMLLMYMYCPNVIALSVWFV